MYPFFPQACVKVKNMESNVGAIWDKKKFTDQKFLMSELYRRHILDDTNETPEVSTLVSTYRKHATSRAPDRYGIN